MRRCCSSRRRCARVYPPRPTARPLGVRVPPLARVRASAYLTNDGERAVDVGQFLSSRSGVLPRRGDEDFGGEGQCRTAPQRTHPPSRPDVPAQVPLVRLELLADDRQSLLVVRLLGWPIRVWIWVYVVDERPVGLRRGDQVRLGVRQGIPYLYRGIGSLQLVETVLQVGERLMSLGVGVPADVAHVFNHLLGGGLHVELVGLGLPADFVVHLASLFPRRAVLVAGLFVCFPGER